MFALWKNPTPGSFRWRELMRNREANQNIFALIQPIFEVRWGALWVWWASPHLRGNGGHPPERASKGTLKEQMGFKKLRNFLHKNPKSTIWARKVQIVGQWALMKRSPSLNQRYLRSIHMKSLVHTFKSINCKHRQVSTGMKDMGNGVYYSSLSGTYHWKSINMSWGRGVLVMKK